MEGVKVILEEWVIVIITHASGSIIIANGASADRVGESIAVSGHRRVDIFSLVFVVDFVPYSYFLCTILSAVKKTQN